MEYRDLGRTGLKVSEIGFGAWAIGGDAWGPVEDADSLAAMERALELGINFIDTADVYGEGHSESLVSKVISGSRDEVVLSTKGASWDTTGSLSASPSTTGQRRSSKRWRRASSA